MANHSYFKTKHTTDKPKAEGLLKALVKETLGEDFRVEPDRDWLESQKDALAKAWFVILPGTEIISPREALKCNKASGEPYGFMVWLNKDLKTWSFRHPSNPWEYWAQCRILQVLARQFGVDSYSDEATEDSIEVDPEALKSTFKAYLLREGSNSLNQIQSYFLSTAPEGFRD